MEQGLALNQNLSENLDYNIPALPVKARYGDQSPYANGKAPCHWHSDIECIYMLEGTLNYYVNDQAYVLHPGEGIFVNANRLHFNEPKGSIDPKT